MSTESVLLDRINNGTACVGIVGLGYVGLPLVLCFARRGLAVRGFDVDGSKIESLKQGKSYIRHIPGDALSAQIKEGRFVPTTDFSVVKECDALLLCVPTPLTRNREPDMQYVVDTARTIGPHLRQGQLVVLESTTYPGTTEEVFRQVLEEKSKLVAGKDFLLAYSPEREDPGNVSFDTQRIPKLVGGLTPACREAAVALYRVGVEKVVGVSSPRVAEFAKLLENIFRSVNIALVNEMKLVCEKMDIDVWEVIEAAATKPFGFMPFYPGPGLGGHCIPIDPFYLTWKAREFGLSTRFIELAGEVNTAMPAHVIRRTAEALNQARKPLNGSRILVLGIAYKPDVDDVRESPAMEVMERLINAGAQVEYHDPFIPHTKPMRRYDLTLQSVELTDEALGKADAVVIVTNHAGIDYGRVVSQAQLVIDTRNATRDVTQHRDRIVKA